MKKCVEKPVKKTSDEEAQEPVEETETKKGKEGDTDPEKQVEKGEEELEREESSEMAMMKKILATLERLVSSDKKVHKEVEKGEPPEEDEADKEEEKEKKKNVKEEESRAKKEEKKDEGVKKAAMEQDFQKALNDAIAPLRSELDLLKAEVQKIGDEPLLKAGIYLKELQIDKDGKPEKGNAGMIAEQRKKTAGK